MSHKLMLKWFCLPKARLVQKAKDFTFKTAQIQTILEMPQLEKQCNIVSHKQIMWEYMQINKQLLLSQIKFRRMKLKLVLQKPNHNLNPILVVRIS